jgi:hypothetical protein
MNTCLKALVASAILFAASSASAQTEVRFTGETTADDTLIRDVMQHLISYIHDNLKCDNVELVEAKVLPEESIERDPADPEGTQPATYENWVATYCGTSKSFRVVFWASKEGGTMFRIALRPAGKS